MLRGPRWAARQHARADRRAASPSVRGVLLLLRDEEPRAAGGGAGRWSGGTLTPVDEREAGAVAGIALRAGSVQPLVDVGIPVLLGVLTLAQLVADEPNGNVAVVTVCALA